jgi:hypothetical protein
MDFAGILRYNPPRHEDLETGPMWIKLLTLVRRNRRLFQAAVVIVIFAVIFRVVDWARFFEYLRTGRTGYFAATIFALSIFFQVTAPLPLLCLLRGMGIRRIGWRQVWVHYPKLSLAAQVLPARSGDFGLMYFLKDRVPPPATLAAVLNDKLITLGMNAVLVCLGVGYFFNVYWSLSAFALLAACAALGYAVLFGRHLLKLRKWLIRTALGRHKDKVEGFDRHSKQLYRNPGYLLLDLCCTAAILVAGQLMWLMAYGFLGVTTLRFLTLLFTSALNQTVAKLPISINGLGVCEGISIACLQIDNVDPSAVLIVAFCLRVSSVLVASLLQFMVILFAPRMRATVESGSDDTVE